jgi:hypothetical protein
MRPLLFLLVHHLLNSLRRALRQPRLMLPGILLLLGIGFQLVLFFVSEHSGEQTMTAYTPTELLMGKPAAFLLMMRGLLLLSLFTALMTALGEGNTFFDRSDVDFLFTAPIPRRYVLLYKMLGRYTSLLFPAAYLPLAFAGAYLAGSQLNVPAFFPGIVGSWLFLIGVANITQVFLLHPTRAEGQESKTQERTKQWARHALVAVLVLGVGLILVRGVSAWDVFVLSRHVHENRAWSLVLPDAWAADLFRIVFEGYHPGDTLRLIGLLLFASLSFVWLFARDRDFYEAAMELSIRRARLTAAVQSGDAGAVLSQMAQEGRLARGRTLPDFGGGARAILWKDLVAATRIPLRNWLQLLIPAAFPAILGGLFGRENGFNVLGWTVLYSLQMPGIFLLTLRDVLRRSDISKSLPISPLKMLAGELALPLIQLTLLGWLSLGLVYVARLWQGPFLLVAVTVLPSLAALLFFIQAVFVLIYPNPNDPAQHAVSSVLSLGLSLLALLPALLVGIPLYLLGVSPLLLAIAISTINTVFAAVTLLVASHLWKEFDPTD